THIPVSIIELFINGHCILIGINSLFIKIQALISRTEVEPCELIIRMVVEDILMQSNALFIPAGVFCPETNFIQSLFVIGILLQDQAETIENLFKVFIIIIYICQLEQQIQFFLAIENADGLFQNLCCPLLLVQRKKSIRLQYVKID